MQPALLLLLLLPLLHAGRAVIDCHYFDATANTGCGTRQVGSCGQQAVRSLGAAARLIVKGVEDQGHADEVVGGEGLEVLFELADAAIDLQSSSRREPTTGSKSCATPPLH